LSKPVDGRGDRGRIRVAAVCGSLTPESHTMHALRWAASVAQKSGAEVKVVDLREYDLPILHSPFDDKEQGAAANKLKSELCWAEAFLFASPEYHGSLSGALKNALDLMGFEEFEGKLVALIGVAGGAMGAIHTLDHMRTIFRQLHAWVLPDQVSIAGAASTFDKHGRPSDEKLDKRLAALGQELVRFAMLHRESRSDRFVKLWEKSVQNPGGEGR
jgi:NAD(P)H-dependent FMN reductase